MHPLTPLTIVPCLSGPVATRSWKGPDGRCGSWKSIKLICTQQSGIPTKSLLHDSESQNDRTRGRYGGRRASNQHSPTHQNEMRRSSDRVKKEPQIP